MVKTLALSIVILFICGGVVSAFNGDNISKPLSNGNWLYVGGSGEGNYSKIQDALDNASDGDTIFVYNDSSPYYENLQIYKGINLRGEDKNTTIIDGSKNVDPLVILIDSNLSVTINGFTIENADAGIIGRINHSKISENIFTNFGTACIGLQESSYNIISNNIMIGIDFGICLILDYSNHNIISNNIIKSDEGGINLFFSFCNKIHRNMITNITSNYGISLFYSFANVIRENNFVDNINHAYFNNSAYNLWLRNYWDDWSSIIPRSIEGTRFWPFLMKTTSWKTFDLHPAKIPYNITMGV